MNRLIASIIAMLTLTCIAPSALAVYDPGAGRFLQRDPSGYPDGANAYAAYHVMRGGVDPSGLKIRIECSPEVDEYLTSNGVSEYTMQGPPRGARNWVVVSVKLRTFIEAISEGWFGGLGRSERSERRA
ncbi:MAG: hypothetical protein AAGH88_12235, partial [Planctomycetota bacterium]